MGGRPKGVPHPGYPKHKKVTPAVTAATEVARTALAEVRKEEMERKKKEFLSLFLETQTLSSAATKMGITKQAVAFWIADDPEFAKEYLRLKLVRDIVREEDEEDFLHAIGTGAQQTGKDTGLGMPNVVAAKMGLTARNPKKWSERITHDSNKQVNIVKIEYTRSPGREITTIVDAQDIKELPSG